MLACGLLTAAACSSTDGEPDTALTRATSATAATTAPPDATAGPTTQIDTTTSTSSTAATTTSVAAPQVPTPETVCADPDDCRLWEAGEIAGVRVGLAGFSSTGDRQRVQLAESNIVENHELSWRVMQPAPGEFQFEGADQRYEFAQQHGLHSSGFHFAWEQDILDDLADWVLDITDPDELRRVLTERATAIFERYPELDRINVINEPLPVLGGSPGPHPNHFFDVLGPDYIVELFQIVDSVAPPTVELVLNENFVEYVPDKAAALVALVADLLAKGAPIDSVGFQTHIMLTELLDREPDWDLYQRTMAEVADLGVTVWISELDNPVDPARPDRLEYQADNYRRAVEACLSVDACTDIMVWGVEDQPQFWFDLPYDDPAPLLFGQDFQPKPAYFAVRDALLRGRP